MTDSESTQDKATDKKDVPVQGVLPGDKDGFEFVRPVANPSDANEGDEPGYMQRARDKK